MSLVMLLNWAALAVSFFNAISLLWLGLMVLLSGSRKSVGTLLAGGGLLLAALFFISHTAILGRGLGDISFGMDFWWWVSWTPAVVAPLVWYGAMLWYTGFRLDRPHPHQPWLAGVAALAVTIAGLLIFANPLPSYQSVAGRELVETPSLAGIPVLALAYLLFSMLCYLLPLDLLRRAEKLDQAPAATGSGLRLAAVARRRARPLLAAATLSLLLAALGMVWTVLWALNSVPPPSLRNLADLETVLGFDLGVDSLVALAITLLGRAVVAYEVFTGRPLPRTGFFRQWRSTVLLAGGYGLVAAWTLTIQLRALYGLMMATALVTVFYALYSWRSFAEREHFMERLRPFIASQNLYGQMVESGPPVPSAAGGDLFNTLCRDVLGVQSAALVPAGALAALAGPPLVYAPGEEGVAPPEVPIVSELAGQFSSPEILCLPAGSVQSIGQATGLAWAVSLWNERGLGGLLLLGEKVDCNPFTQEEMEIAQAGGERLLDMLAGVEMARLAMDLLRQRLSQQRVLEGRSRRVLHDEVLPELHTAILYLSSQQDVPPGVRQAIETLARAHRNISDLMRDSLPNVPQRLEQGGLVQALQAVLEGDLAGEFSAVKWQVDQGAAEALGRFPLLVSEVVYFAGRELLRNAARHGRGGDSARPLHLTVALEQNDGLRLVVEDDGVGLSHRAGQGYLTPSGAPRADGQGHLAGGTGSGLRFHSAMLAAVGASLEVGSCPGCGTRGVIVFPEEKA